MIAWCFDFGVLFIWLVGVFLLLGWVFGGFVFFVVVVGFGF